MKVVAINGSPRKNGNTEICIREVFAELEHEGISTEICQVGGLMLAGCKSCGWCAQNKVGRCVQDNDAMNDEIIPRVLEADGLILASPTYYCDLTPEIKAVMDRAGYVARCNGGLLRRKVGAAIAVCRRGGAIHAFDSLNHFFLINEMMIPGSSYWNIAYGLQPGDVTGDAEGLRTMRTLGQNMAWLLKKLHA